MLTADQVIDQLDLQLLPEEGGLFRQTYLSDEIVHAGALPPRYKRDKAFSTAIYYMLTDDPDSFSALHILPTDEIYHFYLGDPVELLLLFPDSRHKKIVLGQDVLADQHVQFVVPREVWQGSYLLPGGRFALMGTTMAPGFDFQDYVAGDRSELSRRYPEAKTLIERLTR
jgi:predicted cupin superfamily sugar epimerase